MTTLRTLPSLDVTNKAVLVRVDLNVPMRHGKVEDATRITRLVPTLQSLIERKAKVVVLSHFGRPKGEFVRDMSLAPLADALGEAMGGVEIKFAVDCIGEATEIAVKALQPGEVLLLENVRFHAGEEKNDPLFADALASLGDCYVNDTFSCSHRAHASIVGLAERLPSAAGLLLQDEIENLERVLEKPKRPLMAITGGAKVSTKLELLENLLSKVDSIVIGGAMANTFLKAQGYNVGKSLYEEDLVPTARAILEKAQTLGREIILPTDVVVAYEFKERTQNVIVPISDVPNDGMILDVGPDSIMHLYKRLGEMASLVWNGPLGAFEMQPFDNATVSLARKVASLTRYNGLVSVAGGGDVVAAVKMAGLSENFTYVSTAGGAFLEWLEGKVLPGVAILQQEVAVKAARA